MTATLRTPVVTQVLRLLPASLLGALDGWSSRVAQRRAQARRMAGARKTSPLPPVVSGWPALPHPWRD
jgi:hypothetical protein